MRYCDFCSTQYNWPFEIEKLMISLSSLCFQVSLEEKPRLIRAYIRIAARAETAIQPTVT